MYSQPKMSHENLQAVLEDAQETPEAEIKPKYGFVVYRCTYGDGAKWRHLISYLTTQARIRLQKYGNSELFDLLDWNVQGNTNELNKDNTSQVHE